MCDVGKVCECLVCVCFGVEVMCNVGVFYGCENGCKVCDNSCKNVYECEFLLMKSMYRVWGCSDILFGSSLK